MNKTSVIIASVLATTALYSCNSDDNNTYESTFARNIIVAVSDPAGTTKYTATVASFTMDMYSPQESKMVIATIKKPDGKIINMGTCENLTLGASTTQMDYTSSPTQQQPTSTSTKTCRQPYPEHCRPWPGMFPEHRTPQ